MEPAYCTLCFKKCFPKAATSEITFGFELGNPQVNEGDEVLKNGLQVIFLIRKMLKIPQEVCCNFLANYGDPGSWIDFCDTCLDLVQQAKRIFDQIVSLEKQFETLQNQIKHEITQMAPFPEIVIDQVKMEVKETIKSFIRHQGVSRTMNTSLGDFLPSNLNATELSCSDVPPWDINEQSFPIIKDEMDMDNSSGVNPFGVTLFETNDYCSEEDDPLRFNESVSCSNTYCDVSIKEEPQSTELRHSESEQAYIEPNPPLVTSHEMESSPGYDIRNKTIPQNHRKSKSRKELNTGEKRHKCNICGKVLSSRKTFSQHKKIHAADKPWKCKFCGKGHTVRCNLILHERTHTGERPFECDTCGKTFSGTNVLNKHKRIHSGERPYQCRFCYKTFLSTSTLTVHERIHTGEKPYKCDTCGEAFAQTHSLSRHKRKHSGDNL